MTFGRYTRMAEDLIGISVSLVSPFFTRSAFYANRVNWFSMDMQYFLFRQSTLVLFLFGNCSLSQLYISPYPFNFFYFLSKDNFANFEFIYS